MFIIMLIKLLIVAGQDQFDYPDTQNKLTDDVVEYATSKLLDHPIR